MFADFKIPIQILYCVESIEVNGKKMKDKGRDCRETIVISKKELLELTKGKQLDKELLSFFSSKNLIITGW